ncbi:MAG: enoyl-CoA hydratase/isomerase family protein [Desulfobacteraceae bacterium]
MALVDFQVDGHVAIVSLNDGENRFNPTFLDALLAVMDEIEHGTEATTLVVHSTHEKIFSNGIDLEWLLPVLQQSDFAKSKRYFYHLNRLFKRWVTYPLVTIASIGGHAFAGGAIYSCAFDFRFMRTDRGYFCLPEVDLGIPFLPGMNAILRSAIPEIVLREMQLTGVRMTAQMCQTHGIVKGAYPRDELLDATLQFARQVNKKRAIIGETKRRLNKAIVDAIDTEDPAHIESGRFYVQ